MSPRSSTAATVCPDGVGRSRAVAAPVKGPRSIDCDTRRGTSDPDYREGMNFRVESGESAIA